MEKNKDILIVIIATLIFGGASKILVGVPYMAWGYFDQLFIAAFILWTFYSAALYVAIKIENRKNENRLSTYCPKEVILFTHYTIYFLFLLLYDFFCLRW